jgi:hypothetical protein
MVYIIRSRSRLSRPGRGYGLIIATRRYALIHENRRELHPFDVSPVPTGLPPSADKPFEGLAVQFCIRSITLGIDLSIPGFELREIGIILRAVPCAIRPYFQTACPSR